MVLGLSAVNCNASHVRPLRSPAIVFAATAGPTQVTTAKASEKKVWKMPTPTFAGSAVVLATPPTEQMRSVIMPVTTERMMGVRCRRAACLSSRIQTGLGFSRRRDQIVLGAEGRREGGGREAGVGTAWPSGLVIADLRG
jgi:hypothetical protein